MYPASIYIFNSAKSHRKDYSWDLTLDVAEYILMIVSSANVIQSIA
jgi:hypothetical protein